MALPLNKVSPIGGLLLKLKSSIIGLVFSAVAFSGCSSSPAVSDSDEQPTTGSFDSPLNGSGPLVIGDWADVSVNAVALCVGFVVIEVSGTAAVKDSQSLDSYIEGLVESNGVIARPYRYYVDNPGPFCPGERTSTPKDVYNTPDVIKGARQTTWVWFEGISDVSDPLFMMTGTGFSSSDRYFIRPSTTSARIESSVAPEAYRIGDVGPAGGTVFIIPSTPGNTTGLYFEVARFLFKVERAWVTWGNQDLSVPGATGTEIGDGAANTAAIARQAGNVAESSAAVYASEYSANGFSDWFLPSKDELDAMYVNIASIGGFLTGLYWSSSELDANYAWPQDFNYGFQQKNLIELKSSTGYVRPVRAFP